MKSYKEALTTASEALTPIALATVMAPGDDDESNVDFKAMVQENSTEEESVKWQVEGRIQESIRKAYLLYRH